MGQFDDYMARQYYIDGLRGEAKKISLPRNQAKKPCNSNSSILLRFSSMRSFFLRIVSLKAALTSSRVLFVFVVSILIKS